MKKTILFLLILMAVSVLLMVVLFRQVTNSQKIRNSFVRILPPHLCDFDTTIFANTELERIVSVDDSGIHLGLSDDVVRLSFDDNETKYLGISSPRNVLFSRGTRYAIDLFNNEVSHISPAGDKTIIHNHKPLNAVTAAGDHRVVMSAIDRESNTTVLETINFKTGIKDSSNQILIPHIDGVFSVDGSMAYSHELQHVVYTYFYRNEFIVMDTALHVLYRGNTIDTNRVAKLNLAKSSDRIVITGVPPVVNKSTFASGYYLFIESNLTARNELPERMKDRAVVDIYDLRNGYYVASFYVSDFEGYPLNSFAVTGKSLFGVHGPHLVKYHLRRSLLDQLTD